MQKKALQMRVSYKANRLAKIYIANAYEKIIPVKKYSTNLIQGKTDASTLTMLRIKES